jgi:hypothetical protein
MNFTKRTLPILGAALALALGAPSAFADNSIYLEVGPNYGGINTAQYGDGGEFTALTTGLGGPLVAGLPAGSEVPSGYSALATMNVGGVTGFETFCIEDQVDFYVGVTYDYTEGYAIQQTGGSLTAGAAWLYQQFAKGSLSGYNYTNQAARLQDAGELQSTLWYLQGEPADPNVFPNQPNDPFTTLVETHFGGGSTPADLANGLDIAEQAASGVYGVKVLELTSLNSNYSGQIAQDQLIYTGVPDGAWTIGLLCLSLAALAAFRRSLPVLA